MIEFKLSYQGEDTDKNQIDFYDVAQALMGFQRSLAITTHLVLNGEIITQAPSLKNAKIVAAPPEKGSWAITAIILTALYKTGTAPKGTPLGHLVHSAYDFIVARTLGFNVNYDESLGQQYEKLKISKESEIPVVTETQLDAAIEKGEYAIQEMHRPIIKSKTANTAYLSAYFNDNEIECKHALNQKTYAYMMERKQSNTIETIVGRVSSYNINSYKGRIFVPEEKRPIPFQLGSTAKDANSIGRVSYSLDRNAFDRTSGDGFVTFKAFRNTSRTGRLINLQVIGVE